MADASEREGRRTGVPEPEPDRDSAWDVPSATPTADLPRQLVTAAARTRASQPAVGFAARPRRSTIVPPLLSQREQLLLVTLVAAATRLPLIGRTPGEPDAARFLFGLWQWVHLGVAAPGLYGDFLSPGFYAAGGWLIALLHLRPAAYPWLFSGLSAVATILAAPLLLLLARRIVAAPAALAATLLFLLAPGYWWLGIETHPQGLALPLFLAGIYALTCWWERAGSCRPAGFWAGLGLALGGFAGLLGGLLLRGDLLLFWGFFPVWYWVLGPLPSRPRGIRHISRLLRTAGRTLAASLPVPLAALAAFFLLRAQILAKPMAQLQHESSAVTAGYIQHGWLLMHQQWGYTVKQFLPFLFTLGPWVALWMLVGVALWHWHWRHRRRGLAAGWRWWLLAASFSLPSSVFWVLVLGNTARHVIYLTLPLLWWAAAGWLRAGRRWLLVSALLAVALNWTTIRPHSQLTLDPAANVPGSHRLLQARLAELTPMRDQLQRLARAAAPVCYFGFETVPPLQWMLVTTQPAGRELVYTPGREMSTLGGLAGERAPLRFYETYSTEDFRSQSPGCAVTPSLEFGANWHRQVFGREGDPLARFYKQNE